jgi:predicted nucleotidyltransferase component of viral defense system
MFTKAISKQTKATLALLGKSRLLKDAYLAGGTAVALQLGHRLSFDLDFFTPKVFNSLKIIRELNAVTGFKLEESTKDTIWGEVGEIKFSLFLYNKYKLLFPLKRILGINIADLRDIAAMKIVAIAERGLRRDFIDLYFICKKFRLKDILKFYNKKYAKLSSNIVHIKKSLVYFIDAENEQMPQMLKPCMWQNVKGFFEKEVKKI